VSSVDDAQRPAVTTPPGRVLVVDDVEANRALVAASLTCGGYVVDFAVNGHDALDIVARDQPDLVLMDVMMPKAGGFAACRALKRDPTTERLHKAVMSADRAYEELTREAGRGWHRRDLVDAFIQLGAQGRS